MSFDPNAEFQALLAKPGNDERTAERIRELKLLGADIVGARSGNLNRTAGHSFGNVNRPESLAAVFECGVDVFAADHYRYTALDYVLTHSGFEDAAEICFRVMDERTDRDWGRIFTALMQSLEHADIDESQDFLFQKMGVCIGWAFEADAFERAQEMVKQATAALFRRDRTMIGPLLKSWRNWAENEGTRSFFEQQIDKPELYEDPDKPKPLTAEFLRTRAGIGEYKTAARHPRPVIDMGIGPDGKPVLDYPAA